MKPLTVALALLLALIVVRVPQASAQQSSSGNEAELIQRLLTRIDQLEKRVADLEAGKPQVVPPASRVVPLQPPADVNHADMGHAAPAEAAVEGPNLKIAGFSDFNFSGSDQPGTRSGFSEGQFILHLNSNLTPKVSYMGELSLTARTDAGTGIPAATGFNAEVERSIIRFEHSDYLKV